MTGSSSISFTSTTNRRLVRTGPAGRVLYLGEVEVTATGASRTVTRYVTVAGTLVAVTTTTGTGGRTVTWNCADRQDSITCQAPTTGTAPALRRYLPYGAARNTVTTPGTDRGYLGQPHDTTGLTYLDNRYYDPTVGAFLTVDPLVATTGTPYLYANGNPTTLTDPTGLEPGCGATARGESCRTAHQSATRTGRANYLRAGRQSADVGSVETYMNSCVSTWRDCEIALGSTVGASGTNPLGDADKATLETAMALLIGLMSQGVYALDPSGQSLIGALSQAPGTNAVSFRLLGDSPNDMTLVALQYHRGNRETLTPILQGVALLADAVAVAGGVSCAFTAGVGCVSSGIASSVSGVANLGTASLNCTAGQAGVCGTALVGAALGTAQAFGGRLLGRAFEAGAVPVEFFSAAQAYAAISTAFLDAAVLSLPTGDGAEIGTAYLFNVRGL